ncbi:MAG: hypothetical protein C5B59_09570 [Bacteroidetes bacterium]|nr:MAG: hypothetical protein C5B59_09570 [Bacteroidota bacterium]
MRFENFSYMNPSTSRRIIGLLLLLFFCFPSFAQTVGDSTADKDTVAKSEIVQAPASISDSVKKPIVIKKRPVVRKDSTLVVLKDSSSPEIKYSSRNPNVTPRDSLPFRLERITGWNAGGNSAKTLEDNLDFNFLGKPVKQYEQVHRGQSFEGLFYLLIGVLFYFALVKLVFAKYLSNLFALFFGVSMRQQQIREQVIQSPLPSLLLNILFVMVGGMYGAFLARYYNVGTPGDFWVFFMDFSILIVAIYLGKYLILKSIGWIFNLQRATDTYIFIIFLTNKILGIFLLPFLLMLSFSDRFLSEVAVTLSIAMILGFLVYRSIVSYAPIRKEIKMNGFHFFLYLCAFEIVPLLLIYKVLMNYLEKGY